MPCPIKFFCLEHPKLFGAIRPDYLPSRTRSVRFVRFLSKISIPARRSFWKHPQMRAEPPAFEPLTLEASHKKEAWESRISRALNFLTAKRQAARGSSDQWTGALRRIAESSSPAAAPKPDQELHRIPDSTTLLRFRRILKDAQKRQEAFR